MTNNFDLQSHPFVAMWETNTGFGPRLSDAFDSPGNDQLELTDSEAEQLIRDVAELNPPVFIFAGADPLRRRNIFSLVQYAVSCGLHPSMQLSPESDMFRESIVGLKKANLSRLGLTLDGATPESHDRICYAPGSFARTLQALQCANEIRLPVLIHTRINRRNLHELNEIAQLIRSFRILAWNISFPAPQPAESLHALPSASEFEEAFSAIHNIAQTVPFKVKLVEAPHYRRFVVQQRTRVRAGTAGLLVFPFHEEGIPGVLPINEGKASVFISSTGEIFPSASLRVSAGNVRYQKLADVYRNSALFDSLRDAENLKGKCGDCEFKEMCGGSRARAWALTGDLFAEECCCSYQPMASRKIG